MIPNIRELVDPQKGPLGWMATIEYDGFVVYAIGDSRKECVEKFKRAIVFFNAEYAERVNEFRSHNHA